MSVLTVFFRETGRTVLADTELIYVYSHKWKIRTETVRETCKTCKGAAWLMR
jgi:hypothetical protein